MSCALCPVSVMDGSVADEPGREREPGVWYSQPFVLPSTTSYSGSKPLLLRILRMREIHRGNTCEDCAFYRSHHSQSCSIPRPAVPVAVWCVGGAGQGSVQLPVPFPLVPPARLVLEFVVILQLGRVRP